ncbi:MAG: hypothetical protein AAGF85_21235, partial [Bacteroidota bacterium]
EEIPLNGNVFVHELNPGELVELIEEEIPEDQYKEKLKEIELRAILKDVKRREIEDLKSLVQENEFKSRSNAGELKELKKEDISKDEYVEKLRAIELREIEKQKSN